MRLRCRIVGCLRATPWYGYLLVVVSFLTGIVLMALLLFTKERTVENCSTVNENTAAVYQLALAFKGLTEIIEKETGKPLRVRVTEPEYLDC